MKTSTCVFIAVHMSESANADSHMVLKAGAVVRLGLAARINHSFNWNTDKKYRYKLRCELNVLIICETGDSCGVSLSAAIDLSVESEKRMGTGLVASAGASVHAGAEVSVRGSE